jgi:hypothetical protein
MDLQTAVCRPLTSGFSTNRRTSPRIRHREWTNADFEVQDGKEVSLPTLLVLHVGEVGGSGADLFQVEVTTPEAFRAVKSAMHRRLS